MRLIGTNKDLICIFLWELTWRRRRLHGDELLLRNVLSCTQGHSHSRAQTHRTQPHTSYKIDVVVIHARIILFCSKIHFGGRNKEKSRSIDQSNELRTLRIVQRFRHLLDKCRPLFFASNRVRCALCVLLCATARYQK